MERGYAATSLDTVAEFLGATKGRIYYYYKSKADLFFGVHREANLLSLRTVETIANSPGMPTERLRRMILAHIELLGSHSPLLRVAQQALDMHIYGSTTPDQRKLLDALVTMRDEYERCFAGVLSEGTKSGEFRPCDPAIAIKTLLGGLNWMTTWYRPGHARESGLPKRVTSEIVDFFFHGLVLRRD
jgi:AcrR family transcriptional regulator